MAKRTATSELTDRNWDQEEEAEEAGIFQKATDDTLKSRKIITARRRQPGDSEGKPTAFSGFGGLAFKPTQTSTPLFGVGLKTETRFPAFEKEKKSVKIYEDKAVQEQNGSKSRTTYLASLKELNQSVTQWISQHVEKNPYCLLTPVFKDYETHLAQLEQERDKPDTNGATDSASKTESNQAEDPKPLPKTGLTFGMGKLQTETTAGSAATTASTTSKPGFSGFSFGTAAASSSTATSGFSFAVGSAKPGSSAGPGAEGDADEDKHVPPQVESVQHSEDGSLYSKKCKLFYQMDGAWKERGVGFLHLKNPNEKAQLLVRADTTLGNILLNIRLGKSIPFSRQGKNSISMMCIVNPEIPKVPTDKAIPLLIRVKTALDADELFNKMKEMQN